MSRMILLAFCLCGALPLSAQEGHTKKTAAQMLSVLTENGGRVIVDREVTVTADYSDFTVEATSAVGWYHVTLVFPYSAGYTKIDGYVTYGDEAKRLPFKLTTGDKVGRLYLKVTSKPGYTAHLRFKDDYFHGTLCRLMVVEGQ